MKIWFRLKESINLFRLLAKKGYICLYQLGIMVIALWTLASLAITYRKVFLNPFEALTVNEMPAMDQGWFVAMMTNIVSSEANRIVGKGLLFLLIWILLFLFIPLATRSLKRFRLFQFELELEDSNEAEEPGNLNMEERFRLLGDLYSDHSKGTLFLFYQEDAGRADYEGAIAYFLEKYAAEGFKKQGVGINWALYEWAALPDEWMRLAQISAEKGKPYMENQESTVNFKKKNIVVYTYHHLDKLLVSILWSYTCRFDIMDQQYLYILHHSAAAQLENIEYVCWIERLVSQEAMNECAYVNTEGVDLQVGG
ncbi:hypothetical protein [Pradoshia sp.]|uniref:hypothetical protein n=1 Tax=Pradoshia sp. TaxID=2651281 RepID=UPI003F1198AB